MIQRHHSSPRSLAVLATIPLLGLLAASAAPSAAPSADRPKGTLIIVGGGSRDEPLMHRFVELAGGPGRARVALIPTASEDAAEAGAELKQEFTGYGVDAFVYQVNRDQANDPAMVHQLDSATGIWFGGGDQLHLTDALGGTASLRAIQARYRAGAVVGGTSAGAAIMSDSMITGNQTPPGDTTGYYGDDFPAIAQRRIQVIPGLGFLSGAVVDQHFIKRERHNRLLSAILERPSLVGVGIDESTAIEVAPDGRWTVLGLSEVIVYDPRKAHIRRLPDGMFGVTDLRMHILSPGSTYDLKSGKVTLSSR
ncbi:MAG TPA: cyanophycinase [Gemmatimonadales bacterium]|nr:cyanophycinase [Gemmatimonadales bacterium]